MSARNIKACLLKERYGLLRNWFKDKYDAKRSSMNVLKLNLYKFNKIKLDEEKRDGILV